MKMQGTAPKARGRKRKKEDHEDVEEISIDDFMKVDLRVAEVIA